MKSVKYAPFLSCKNLNDNIERKISKLKLLFENGPQPSRDLKITENYFFTNFSFGKDEKAHVNLIESDPSDGND